MLLGLYLIPGCSLLDCFDRYCECFQSGLICGSSCKCLVRELSLLSPCPQEAVQISCLFLQDCHNVHGNPQLSEIRRVPSKKSSHPRRPVPAGGGSDGSPVPGGPASARLSDGEEGSSGRPVRASGRASKRSLARIASQLLLDDDDDDDFDDSDDESSEDEGVKAKPAATLRRDVAPLAMLAKSAPSRSKPKSKEAPPAASPPLVRQPAPPTKRQASKARLPRELHVDVNEAQPAASPAAPPFNDMFQPSSAESHNLSLALPLRRWPPTCVLPCHVPRHRTFGLRNPALSDPMVTTVLSYLANDDIYNSSLVCMAWAALAMDVALWNWDGVEVNATLVAGAPTRDVPLSTDHFDPMVSLTPHRHSRPFAGLPFLDMHDDNMSAMSPARPPGRHAPSFEPAAQTWAPGPNVVRMSMMSPLLAMSPERGYAPDALEAPLHAVKTGGAGKRRR